MRLLFAAAAVAVVLPPLGAQARNMCSDPTHLEIRSQISLNVPIKDSASSADTIKAMEDARRDLYALSNRECDILKSVYGGECTLSAINLNSSAQERGTRNNTVYVSISNVYQIRKQSKQ